MKIFVMRHGKAESVVATSVEQDAGRALTERGFSDAAKMASVVADYALSHVWVSPYLRAQQTCQQVLDNLSKANTNPKAVTVDDITPYGSATSVHDYLDAVIEDEAITSLLIVSHMPLVSYLVEALTGGQHSPVFQTSGIAEIDYDVKAMKGQLVAMHSPKVH